LGSTHSLGWFRITERPKLWLDRRFLPRRHLRRPDGRDWDGFVQVNPPGKEKALAFLYNPLQEETSRRIRIPLHYAGLAGKARISVNGGAATEVELDKTDTATLTVKIPACSRTRLLVAD